VMQPCSVRSTGAASETNQREEYRAKVDKAFQLVKDNMQRVRAHQQLESQERSNFVPFQKGEEVWLKNWVKQKRVKPQAANLLAWSIQGNQEVE